MRVLLVPNTTPQDNYLAPPQQVSISEDVSFQEYPEEADSVVDNSHTQLIPEHPGITNINYYYDNNMYYPYSDCFSQPDNAPIIAAVVTRRIQQFTALHADKHSMLSIDSSCEGNYFI